MDKSTVLVIKNLTLNIWASKVTSNHIKTRVSRRASRQARETPWRTYEAVSMALER
jgi:hypothetical protein